MLSSFAPWCAETCISASERESQKPHQGFAGQKPTLHRGVEWSKSTLALGLPEWAGKTVSGPAVAANNDSYAWTFTKSFFSGFALFGPKNDPRSSCFGNFAKNSVANFVGIPGVDTVAGGAAAVLRSVPVPSPGHT